MLSRQTLRDYPAQFFEQSVKALISLLLLALLGAIFAGVVLSFLELREALASFPNPEGLHQTFKKILVDALTVLAMVEVFRTALAYFTEGRVKVTYIIDTVLVSVLTEVLAFWHREMETTRLVMVIALVLALMLVRIIAIRFSPNRRELCDGL